jgi:two-component system NtrC family response regulator
MEGKVNMTKPVVLIIDDQYRTLHSLPRYISADAFSPVWVPDEQHALNLLKKEPDKEWIIIIDLKSSGMGGGGFLHQARQIAPQAAVLVIGPLGPFLYKGGSFYEFSGPTLKEQINTILCGIGQGLDEREKPEKRPEFKFKRKELKERFGAIIGRSQALNEIYDLIDNLRDSAVTVLIQGESGTGKELIARTIHETSARRARPFVAINCGAIPDALIESELFGHERGAFTTALYKRKGKFEIAQGGTLFLDEIGVLNRELQARLLRVLQEKEFQRVGGNSTFKTDVRIIAATNRDLRKAVQLEAFREDLFYRLNVLPIFLQPLRERKEDIPLLLDHFFHKTAGGLNRPVPPVGEDALKALFDYGYPGNVRELANIVERIFVVCRPGPITLEDLPAEVQETINCKAKSKEVLRELPEEGILLQEVEKQLIFKTLQTTSGNKCEAARKLGITRRLLYLRLAQYGLN